MQSMKILISLLIACALPAYGALGVVNANCGQASNSTITASPITTTAGNAMVAFVNYANGGGACATTVINLTNTAGDTWASVGSISGATGFTCSQAFYAKNIIGNASDAVSVNWTGVVNNGGITVVQISGADTTAPLDQGPAAGLHYTGVGPAESASYTTTAANEILVTGIAEYGVVGTFTPDSGFAVPANAECNTRTTQHISLETKIVSSIQTGVTSGFASNIAFQEANVEVVTLKAGAAAAGTKTPAHSGVF